MRQQRHKRGSGRYRAHEALIAGPALSAPVQDGRPIIFAETDGKITQPAKRLQSAPLLDRWPEGYKSFRIDGNDILFSAPGQADLRLEGAL
jgi:hypothetical protein